MQLCGFHREFKTKQALVRFLEESKLFLDESREAGAVMVDLSKAFDCLRHNLLSGKLHSHCFSYNFLSLIQSFLYQR